MKYYVDFDFYKYTHLGELNEVDFLKLSDEAQEKIDEITFNRIVKIGFERLTQFQQEKIRKAMCYQIDYISKNGNDDSDDISSYSVLDISVTVDKTSKKEADKINMSSIAYSYLKKTGLTNRSFRWH